MQHFDVIVVGGGSAGAALAARLSDDPDRSVLLLEAGPDYARVEDFPFDIQRGNVMSALVPGSPYAWPLVSQWTAEARLPLPRGRIIGGGSSVNGAYYVRGLAADFARWAAAGNPQWSFDKVLPFFRRSESDREYGSDEAAHGSNGPIPVTRASREQMFSVSERFVQACLDHGFPEDWDKNGRDTGDGIGPLPVNIEEGVRINAAMGYLTPRRGRPNLTIQGGVDVRRVLLHGQRAVGVEAVTGGQRRVIRGEEVILSAGAAKSPHLLMLSGLGPADELLSNGINVVQDLPGVGKDYFDHTEIFLDYKATEDPPQGPTDTAYIESVLHYTASDSDSTSDIEIMPTTMPTQHALMGKAAGISPLKGMTSAARHPLGMWRALRGASAASLARMSRSMGNNAFIVSVLDQASRGEMRLTSDDPQVFLESQHHLLSEPEDRRRMREAISLSVDLLRSAAFQPMVKEISSPAGDILTSDRELDRWMLRSPGPSGHLMGTCKMGPDSMPGTVVDEHCRVHGVDNLRVVDLSVLPEPVRRGPNATAITVGERAADLIRSGGNR